MGRFEWMLVLAVVTFAVVVGVGSYFAGSIPPRPIEIFIHFGPEKKVQ
jgi:hypothetical protein